jgi:hypothetical protein
MPESVNRWFVVGNNYPAYPGVYTHIDKGGIYTVGSDEKGCAIVTNAPTGTGAVYSHPLRLYVGASKLVNIAHNTVFYDQTD